MQDILNLISWTWYFAGGCILFVLLIACFISRRIAQKIQSHEKELPFKLIEHCHKPGLFMIVLLTCNIVLPLLKLPAPVSDFVQHIFSLCIIATVAWLLIQLTTVFEDFILGRYDIGTQDNLTARKIHTQLRVINKIVIAIICMISVSAMLMTFEKVKQLGTSILASAGIAGIIIGFAAQRSLATLLRVSK